MLQNLQNITPATSKYMLSDTFYLTAIPQYADKEV